MLEDVVLQYESPRGVEKLLDKIGMSMLLRWSDDGLVECYPLPDDTVEKANATAKFFDLNAILQVITDGGSASDVMAPLRIFLQSLEFVATTHPFVGIAVLPFRAIVKLELDRRANDRRILTLISHMADMMQNLKHLPNKKIAEEHATLLEDILARIKVCHGRIIKIRSTFNFVD